MIHFLTCNADVLFGDAKHVEAITDHWVRSLHREKFPFIIHSEHKPETLIGLNAYKPITCFLLAKRRLGEL